MIMSELAHLLGIDNQAVGQPADFILLDHDQRLQKKLYYFQWREVIK